MPEKKGVANGKSIAVKITSILTMGALGIVALIGLFYGHQGLTYFFWGLGILAIILVFIAMIGATATS